MAKQYSSEFKMEAIKRVESSEGSIASVAKELGVNTNTLHGWLKKFREKPDVPFPGSGKLSTDDELIKKLERQIRDLREENEILKKAAAYFAKNLK
ncbi:transposase [Desulfotomaculum nigrificans]|uniref:transposase n=1 Tax=Desulfotomaculum nigrificans TaxID=1565 RepID=UPI0004805A76|nr:transposase [Desulfotomaculum nigrificans]